MLVSCSLSAASGDQGRASAVFLKLDPAARTAGLGSAFVSRVDDVNAVYVNPSGLGFIGKTQALATYNDIFADIKYSYLAGAMPLRGGKNGGVGISVTLLDYGSMNRTEIAGNNPITGLGTFSADDFAVSLAYGKTYNQTLGLGFTLRYVKENIYNYDADAVAGDIGARWITEYPGGLSIGLAIRNIGGSLTYMVESDPLPLTFVGGFSVSHQFGPHNLCWSFDLNSPNDYRTYIGTGIEYVYNRFLSARVGYDGQNDAGSGLTAGLGFNLQNLSVDYAFIPYDDIGDQHRVSLSYVMGGTR